MMDSPPTDDQFEVTILGTGGGYGESIVVHLGTGKWIIIDSCVDPKKNSVLPLEYLRFLKVNLSEDVISLICTHWHDDHIRGMSSILSECSGAEFWMAKVNDAQKFMAMLQFDLAKEKVGQLSSSTKEFNKCLEILVTRRAKPQFLWPDRLVQKIKLPAGIRVEVFALSPSDKTIQDFDQELTSLFNVCKTPNKKIVIQTPNDKSVVVLLKFGAKHAILGADLEMSNDPDTGWTSIMRNSAAIDGPVSYFKVPHHGSDNAYSMDLWTQLVQPKSVSTISPWNKKKVIPTDEMINKFKAHPADVFLTSQNTRRSSPKRRDREIEKMVDELLRGQISEMKYEHGIVRSRIRHSDPNWTVELFGTALKK
jgi:beta-lactamase superfamily II metal-dependent hydrolase